MNKFVENLVEIYKLPYFHGDITKEKAIATIKNRQPGSFLVRCSSTTRSNFTITYINNESEVRHTFIVHPPLSSKFWINGTNDVFTSIDECITVNGKNNGLVFPVPKENDVSIELEYINLDWSSSSSIVSGYNPKLEVAKQEIFRKNLALEENGLPKVLKRFKQYGVFFDHFWRLVKFIKYQRESKERLNYHEIVFEIGVLENSVTISCLELHALNTKNFRDLDNHMAVYEIAHYLKNSCAPSAQQTKEVKSIFVDWIKNNPNKVITKNSVKKGEQTVVEELKLSVLVGNWEEYLEELKQDDKLFQLPTLVALSNYLECSIIIISDFSSRPCSIKFESSNKSIVLGVIGGKLLIPFVTKKEVDKIFKDEYQTESLMQGSKDEDEEEENFDL
eukprot:TRINITY_DN4370_c0_g1_i1.p1 TRINITY_DN4370_c0_g1~~TRINITY_DN4370_c0_g1_i1.p1  ORF type:complete len:391 (+),score=105.07 TRINITY_DN4370_c0_g1_i1:1396-2568(+)